MSNARLMIVHPSATSLSLLRSMLFVSGARIDEATSDREAVRLLERSGTDLVLVGADPSDPDALELLDYVKRKHPRVPVVLLFSVAHPERVREALQRGASAVLRFPLPANELRAAVAQALEPLPSPLHQNGNGKSNGNGSMHAYQGENGRDAAAGENETLLGRCPAVQVALELASAIAPTRTPVLITGERGVGKCLLARTIHMKSPRRGRPFVRLDCSAAKNTNVERELFGQRSNGLTEKTLDRPGKVLQAEGGTLFLSSVEALTPEVQYKLLRVVQDLEFEPVGSTQTVRADVRIVASSTEDLANLVAQGRFRQDLFDRFSAVCLKLPPLRQRGSDIELLANHFRERSAREHAKAVTGFAPEAIASLKEHPWAGNVRELEEAVERGVIVCRGPRIAPAHLALSTPESRAARPSAVPRPHMPIGIRPLKEALEEPEKQLILQALEALNWNRQETARVLDINRTTLYKKMKKYGLLTSEHAFMA